MVVVLCYLLPDDTLPVVIWFISPSSHQSPSRSSPYNRFPGGDTRCPSVISYSPEVPCPGPLPFLTCSITSMISVFSLTQMLVFCPGMRYLTYFFPPIVGAAASLFFVWLTSTMFPCCMSFLKAHIHWPSLYKVYPTSDLWTLFYLMVILKFAGCLCIKSEHLVHDLWTLFYLMVILKFAGCLCIKSEHLVHDLWTLFYLLVILKFAGCLCIKSEHLVHDLWTLFYLMVILKFAGCLCIKSEHLVHDLWTLFYLMVILKFAGCLCIKSEHLVHDLWTLFYLLVILKFAG